ncbi:MAG: hypothetical protein HYY04_12520 [Chloroflexi bacterium]|nr:hypothetical protein [Chloroflexota bacterium]
MDSLRFDPPSDLADEQLQRLLIDRWLYRGALLALLVVLAILVTTLSAGGLDSVPRQIVVGVLIVAGGAATIVFVAMRHQDRKLYRLLRDRRRRQRSASGQTEQRGRPPP